MNIFFAASIHGKPRFESHYRAIVDKVKALGHKIEADYVLKNNSEDMAQWSDEQDLKFHKAVLETVKQSDAVFADVSYPSTSVGYLIAAAIQVGKPTVIFYSGQEEPHLFRSLENVSDKVQFVRYTSIDELGDEIPFAVEFAINAQDTRFNFFITPDLVNYLNWVAKSRKIPRSVYLRDLIDADMERQGYKE